VETLCLHYTAIILVKENTAEVTAEVTATLDELVGLPATLDVAEEWLEDKPEVIVLLAVDTAAGRPEGGPETNPQ
jgi:hypothetical protein